MGLRVPVYACPLTMLSLRVNLKANIKIAEESVKEQCGLLIKILLNYTGTVLVIQHYAKFIHFL